MTRRTALFTFVALLSVSSVALAQSDDDGRRGRRHGPPQEAFDACDGLAQGDACVFETRRGELEGTCFQPRRGEGLVCRPNDMPERGERRGRRQGPPQEAFDACDGLAEGDACSVETPEGSREGVCAQSRRSDQLVCRPEGARRGRRGADASDEGRRPERKGPPQEAFEACAGLALGDACVFESRRGELEGTCVEPRRGGDLVCRPNDMPRRRR